MAAIDPCGPVCSLPVYPRAVTASLRREIAELKLDDAVKMENARTRLRLPETMINDRNLKDAVVVELEIDDRSVKEVDVLRGREMIRLQTQEFGSICLVVRRPG